MGCIPYDNSGWRTKLGIEPDLAQRIAEKAASKVAKAEVAKEVASDLATEAQIVEVNATAVANVILSHRGDIKRGRGVVASMLYELELECGPENAELLGQLGELMRSLMRMVRTSGTSCTKRSLACQAEQRP